MSYDDFTFDMADAQEAVAMSREPEVYVVIVDNPFNRHWYADLIGVVYTSAKCPPYANFAFCDRDGKVKA